MKIFRNSKNSSHPEDGVSSATGTIAGHEYVDLGLSVKWARCNIGADSPEDYGDYYAWGETSTKSTYTEENSKALGTDLGSDICGNASYDAARANWGESWCLPTDLDIRELISECKGEWTTMNGKSGYKFTSKVNGKSIFLPAAGSRFHSSLHSTDTYGLYLSSTAVYHYHSHANVLYIRPRRVDLDIEYCPCGVSVRPVSW